MLFNDLFWLVALHFIVDFQLQSDFVAANKVPGNHDSWPWVLTAHAAAHGAAVALVLNPVFGFAEFVFHWGLDYAKSKGALGHGICWYDDRSGAAYFPESPMAGTEFSHLISHLCSRALMAQHGSAKTNSSKTN